MIGAVSPPAGDFSEPVTMHTRRFVRSFWALDRQRAQARFYPAIHPLLSYAEDAESMAAWWSQRGNPDWLAQRRRLLTLLEQQAKLERMVRIVGKDALPPGQQLALISAELVAEAVLRQSAMSPVDRYCSPERQTALLRTVMHFVTAAERALAQGATPEAIAQLPVYRSLMRLGEEIPEGALERFDEQRRAIDEAFQRLATDAARPAPAAGGTAATATETGDARTAAR
jgi:V/A-type H+-transporting ATPase subunit A